MESSHEGFAALILRRLWPLLWCVLDPFPAIAVFLGDVESFSCSHVLRSLVRADGQPSSYFADVERYIGVLALVLLL